MKKKTWLIRGFILLLSLFIVQFNANATDEATIQRSKRLLEKLPQASGSFYKTLYFEAKMDNWAVGYCKISIKKKKPAKATQIELLYDATVEITGYSHMVVHQRHIFDDKFKPQISELELALKFITARNVEITSTTRFMEDTIIHTYRQRGSSREERKDLEYPEKPFIFEPHMVLMNLPQDIETTYFYYTINLQEGEKNSITFKVKKLRNGKTRVDIFNQDNINEGYYLFDTKGNLDRFATFEPKAIIYHVITEEKYEELREKIKFHEIFK